MGQVLFSTRIGIKCLPLEGKVAADRQTDEVR